MKRIMFSVQGSRFGVLGCWIALLSLFCAFPCCADDLTTAVIGRWAAEGKTLEFYGRNIGQAAAETTKYFKYEFPAEGQTTFNFGSGTTELFTISIVSNELHLVDSAQQETVYTKVETNLNACVQNLRQLDGAMSLFSLDHPAPEPGLMPNMLSPGDLIPAYLPDLPTCPDGGVYNINTPDGHPTCNVEGHRLDP